MGAHSSYTPEMADRICERLAELGSLRRVCREPGMPHDNTVRKWLVEREDFAQAYARAKEAGIDALVEEALDIADTTELGEERTTKADGSVEVKAGDMLGHRKLRVEYRRWLAERMAPKKYGLKQDITTDGKPLQQAAAPVFNVTLSTNESPKK